MALRGRLQKAHMKCIELIQVYIIFVKGWDLQAFWEINVRQKGYAIFPPFLPFIVGK